MRGNYKKLSKNGCVSIPVSVRREIGLESGDPVEISLGGDGTLMLKAYTPRCVFCGTTERVRKVYGKGICFGCTKMAVQVMEGGKQTNGKSNVPVNG